MASRPARPRRSEPKSYVDLFKPLDLGSSSGSSDDEQAGGGGDALASSSSPNKKKRQKQKARASRPPSDDDDSDISEWEAEPPSKGAAAGKGGKAAAASSDDDDDDEFSAVDTEVSDGPNEEELFDSDDSGFRSPASATGVGGGRAGRGGGGGRAHTPVLKAKAPRVAGIRSTKKPTTTTGTGSDAPPSQRVQPPPLTEQPPTLIDFPWSTLGPHYEPPILRFPAKSTSWDLVEQRRECADDSLRMRCMEAWALSPWGPERSLMQDLGWWKGRWGESGVQSRWGGWFDEVGASGGEGEVLRGDDAINPYLPLSTFPSLPSKIEPTLAATENEGEGERPPTGDEDEDTPMPGGGTPEPSAEEQEQQTAVARETLKLWVGSLAQEGDDEMLGQEKIEVPRFGSHRLDEYVPRKPGYFFNAGAAVLGLDWCPLPDPPSSVEYLAVTTISSPSTIISRSTSPSLSLIQIWSLDTSVASDFAQITHEQLGGSAMRLELGLAVKVGDGGEVKWCPRGGTSGEMGEGDRLGILAGAFGDGAVSLFAVPDPVKLKQRKGVEEEETMYLKASPMLVLALPDTTVDSIAWASHETLAAGCNNGHIAIWNVGAALRSGSATARPIQYFPLHTASIPSLSFLRTPPLSRALDGSLDADGEPTYLVSAGLDGNVTMVDLGDSTAPIVMNHDRGMVGSTAYSPHVGCPLMTDADALVRIVSIRAKDFAQTRGILKLAGAVKSIAASDHHPFVASASAEGVCSITNALRAGKKKAYKNHYTHKVYRLDFNRQTGEYRMLDNLVVEEALGIDATLRPLSGKAVKAKEKHAASFKPLSGAWSPEVGVARVVWHPRLQKGALLASGMMCGLVRVDWCEGGEV